MGFIENLRKRQEEAERKAREKREAENRREEEEWEKRRKKEEESDRRYKMAENFFNQSDFSSMISELCSLDKLLRQKRERAEDKVRVTVHWENTCSSVQSRSSTSFNGTSTTTYNTYKAEGFILDIDAEGTLSIRGSSSTILEYHQWHETSCSRKSA